MNEVDTGFVQVIEIINQAHENAFQKVNEELILMYQAVGKFLSERAKEAVYGDGYMDLLSKCIQEHFPGIKGFNRRGLYRMKQFYELYEGNEKVSPLVTQLIWTRTLIMALFKMFNHIGYGEHAGSGVPDIFQAWRDAGLDTLSAANQLFNDYYKSKESVPVFTYQDSL